MYKLRLDLNALTYDISEVEDYFREIGFLDQYLQLKFNFIVIKDYCRQSGERQHKFLLKDIEEKLLNM